MHDMIVCRKTRNRKTTKRKKVVNLKCKSRGVSCLCEAKVLASGRDGGEDLLAEDLVAFVFWEIEFCDTY